MATKKKTHDVKEIELVPDAWPRFEKMVKAIAKAGPQHRDSSTKDVKRSSGKKRDRSQ